MDSLGKIRLNQMQLVVVNVLLELCTYCNMVSIVRHWQTEGQHYKTKPRTCVFWSRWSLKPQYAHIPRHHYTHTTGERYET